MATANYALFSVIGIEVEYMIIDKTTLEVQPKCDQLIKKLAGEIKNEHALGPISVSNELVLHVLELKNTKPAPATIRLEKEFHETICLINSQLAADNLCLLPTASHPWMDPYHETVRWPHDNHDIYLAYDHIFSCRGHGFANLQSVHINLPFDSDEAFGFLHNAIRLILPFLPSLAASSPFHDGTYTGYLDSRLFYYNTNQQKLPLIAGEIIPEFVQTQADYQTHILKPMYESIAPFDQDKLLQYEWLNSRGAIPKFDYGAIEIRLLDSQECVKADIAIVLLINEVLKSMQTEASRFLKEPIETKLLKQIYLSTLKEGLHTKIESRAIKQQLGLHNRVHTCRDLWHELIEKQAPALDISTQRTLEHILIHGNLSERLLKRLGPQPQKTALQATYQKLAQCLQDNTLYA